LHLRVHPDGSSVLLIDAADAIHLNPTATLLAQTALSGGTQSQAVARLRHRYRGSAPDTMRRHAAAVFRLVEHLRTSTDSCPTCGLAECGRRALFSAPVSAPYKADLALTYGCNNACRHCYNGVRISPKIISRQRGNYHPERSEGSILNSRQILCSAQDDSKTPRDSDPGGDWINTLHPAQSPGRNARTVPLTRIQWRQVLNKLARIGVPHVIFTGGEPTLFPGLCELIRCAGRLGLVSGLNTNGRRLADPDFTAALARAGLLHVQITLESCRAEVHDSLTGAPSFAETVAGIRSALSAGLHTLTNTTLTCRNADHAHELVDYLHRLGLTTIAMNGVIRSGGGVEFDEALSPEDLATVVPHVRDAARRRGMRFLWYTPTPYCRFSPLTFDLGPRRCNAGQYSMCIEPDGGVLPCQSYPLSMGNFLRDPWKNIWNSTLFLRFRERNENPQAAGLPETCWTCPDLPICGGGCPLEWEQSLERAACGLGNVSKEPCPV
jgi:radical SAM protein with 4Fe4S-binding SPASM domain